MAEAHSLLASLGVKPAQLLSGAYGPAGRAGR